MRLIGKSTYNEIKFSAYKGTTSSLPQGAKVKQVTRKLNFNFQISNEFVIF